MKRADVHGVFEADKLGSLDRVGESLDKVGIDWAEASEAFAAACNSSQSDYAVSAKGMHRAFRRYCSFAVKYK